MDKRLKNASGDTELLSSYLAQKCGFSSRPQLTTVCRFREVELYAFSLYNTTYLVYMKQNVNTFYTKLVQLLVKCRELVLMDTEATFFSKTLPVHYDMYVNGHFIFVYKVYGTTCSSVETLASCKSKATHWRSVLELYKLCHAHSRYLYSAYPENLVVLDGTFLCVVDVDNVQREPRVFHPVLTSVSSSSASRAPASRSRAFFPVSNAKDLQEATRTYRDAYRNNFFRQTFVLISALRTSVKDSNVHKCSEYCILYFLDNKMAHKKICSSTMNCNEQELENKYRFVLTFL